MAIFMHTAFALLTAYLTDVEVVTPIQAVLLHAILEVTIRLAQSNTEDRDGGRG